MTAGDQTATLPKNRIPYKSRAKLLSPGELAFYKSLLRAVAGQWTIWGKVRVSDIVSTKRGSTEFAQYRINQKHMDFVSCDPETTKFRAAVELDDKSHDKPSRQERDRFLESVFRAVGIPLIRFRAQASYDSKMIAEEIDGRIQGLIGTGGARNRPIPPMCPKCNLPMKLRRSRESGHKSTFWGCPSFPACHETRKARGREK